MTDNAYDTWPEVPVMYADCVSTDARIKHRIRRAIEKAEDHGLMVFEEELCHLIYEKLMHIPEIRDLANSR